MTPKYQSICYKYGMLPIVATALTSAAVVVLGIYTHTEYVSGGGYGAFTGMMAAVAVEKVIPSYLAKRNYRLKEGSRLYRRVQFSCVATGLCGGSLAGLALQLSTPNPPLVRYAPALTISAHP